MCESEVLGCTGCKTSMYREQVAVHVDVLMPYGSVRDGERLLLNLCPVCADRAIEFLAEGFNISIDDLVKEG